MCMYMYVKENLSQYKTICSICITVAPKYTSSRLRSHVERGREEARAGAHGLHAYLLVFARQEVLSAVTHELRQMLTLEVEAAQRVERQRRAADVRHLGRHQALQ